MEVMTNTDLDIQKLRELHDDRKWFVTDGEVHPPNYEIVDEGGEPILPLYRFDKGTGDGIVALHNGFPAIINKLEKADAVVKACVIWDGGTPKCLLCGASNSKRKETLFHRETCLVRAYQEEGRDDGA